MKHFYTFLCAVSLTASLNIAKAAGGPDAYGYTWVTSLDVGGPVYSWIDVTTRPGVQTVTGLADDNSAPGMINLGFSFHYYWNDYTQLKVGSNGWVAFNTVSNIASCFPTIPTAGGVADNYLAPLMGDLNFTGVGNPGSVQYWSNNIDTFIISYINVPFWSVAAPGWVGANNFQVILCGTDSSITYQYGLLSGFVANAACVDLTVGIENSTGAIGLQVHTDAMPPNNYVIRFDYPSVVLLSIQDALPVWNNNASNVAQFILQNNAFGVTTDIKNAGNTAITTNISLQTIMQDLTPTTVYTGTGSIPTLAAGDDSVYTYTNTWTPTAAGQYYCQTTITNSQDINAANNIRTTEIDVVDPCVSTMTLSYNTTGTPNGSLNWNGGANDDGAAVHFSPPVAPYTINALQYYISSNTGNNFIAQVYADDGPNGAPGTLLFNTTVLATSITAAAWNTVTVSPAVNVTSGGFYVVWLQGGTQIFLGTESAGPRSHQNYEILDASWSTYREDDIEDLCIRCQIGGYAGTPTAGFTSTINQLTFTPTDTTTGTVTSWLWDFGDATSSTLQNPGPHTYASGGTYTVCLTATSSCGSNQACTTITVCQTPTAAFSFTSAGSNVNFMDMTTGTASTFSWDFGDAQTSTTQNPSHTYATGGTYTVCLIVGNICGEADTVCQAVSVCAPNTAAWNATGNALNANFSDMSTGAVDNWSWDFGDPASGPANTSTIQNPVHTFTAPGTYTVCLVVSNLCGNSDTTCNTITVCDVNNASFTYTSVEDSVTVTDMSSGTGLTWFWDFGDGNTSTLQNPGVHHYATGGIYTICLYTTDACGAIDTMCVQDTILITSINVNGAGVNSIYPNPASDVLTVEIAQGGTSVIEIYDITGQLIISEQQNAKIIRVDVSGIARGMYTVRVTNANGTSVNRFIRE